MERGRKKLPELLAPAGGRQAFLGAVKAGADAVYLGGEKFGARAYAENFTQEDIVKSIKEAHILGKKVYLTLNVLTKESEMSETMDFARSLYEAGLDGAIVQDLGVVRMLRERCPGMEIHASTQMSVTGPDSVRFLKELGVVRVVPARELSLSEIRTIKQEEPVDVECFIHGAMCYSYSGRCLMSSFLGGRSGNRGRCAGTCRLPYKIFDENGQYISLKAGKGEQYPLSMRDMCVLEILPDLIDAGIDSFKIEGRMKSPHYAAGVTALYRKYIDRFAEWDRTGRKKPWKVSAADMKKLRSLYLRSDLSTGYYYRRNGRDLLTIGKPGYSGTDDEVLAQIERDYLREPLKKQIRGRAVLLTGRPAALALSAQYGDRTVEAEAVGDTVQAALNRPMTAEEIERRIRKTGDSAFVFSELDLETDGSGFLPVAALNTLRRDALALLEEKILRMTSAADAARKQAAAGTDSAGECDAAEPAVTAGPSKSGSGADRAAEGRRAPEVWAQVMTTAQLDAALRCGAPHIIAEQTPEMLAYLSKHKCPGVILALPHVLRENSLGNLEERLSGAGCGGFMVRNLEELAFLEKKGYIGQIIADGSLYQWNKAARDLLLDHCSMISTGWELSAGDVQPLLEGSRERQLMPVYGRIPMMITAGCVKKTAGQCSHTEKGMYALEDRKGMRFPVRCVCDHCYNVIYNSLPLSLHSAVQKGDPVTESAAGWICSFTDERTGFRKDGDAMQAYAVSYSKYLISASMVLFTLLAYAALPAAQESRRTFEVLQRLCMAVFTLNAFLTMAILGEEEDLFIFGILLTIIVIWTAVLYRILYKNANMLMINNILMMFSIGIVMISRINHVKAQKQLLIALAGILFLLLFPLVRNRLDSLRKGTYIYGALGIAALVAVLLLGSMTNGSKLNIPIAGLTFQPSEFVKILFILFMSSALCEENTNRHIAFLTAAAVAHIGILMLSRDLGSAVIFFVVYVSLLFLATGKWSYLIGGILLGALGAVVCYLLFSHLRVRVQVFLDPWSSIDGSGYQITQSLFAISFGGLFGAGLMQGMPSSIPFVESDFIFAAIIEEMGLIFGICLILLCLNIFTDFLLLSSSYSNKFYQLYTFGTATAFIFQTFLTIGGEVRFIPLTGVTLPLVSYGGSSVLATFTMFGIVSAIFMLQEERLEKFRLRYEEERKMYDSSRNYQSYADRGSREAGSAGGGDGDFYRDFKGVPIYDPSKDYEDMKPFDM